MTMATPMNRRLTRHSAKSTYQGQPALTIHLIVNPFPNKRWFLRVCSTSVLKTQWEKEKLLVMSNFSFSNCVFYLSGELCTIFTKSENVVCKLLECGRV